MGIIWRDKIIEKLNLPPLKAVHVEEAVELRKQRDALLDYVIGVAEYQEFEKGNIFDDLEFIIWEITGMPWDQVKEQLAKQKE